MLNLCFNPRSCTLLICVCSKNSSNLLTVSLLRFNPILLEISYLLLHIVKISKRHGNHGNPKRVVPTEVDWHLNLACKKGLVLSQNANILQLCHNLIQS